jgi:CheY-like chemotaxis protein
MKVGKIAIVDDDNLIRSLMQLKLRKMGYEVETFINGSEALIFYLRNPLPKLIITDIMMPKMGGIELAQNIKKLDKNIPIVAITGGNLDFELESYSLFLFCIEKNGSIDDILAVIFQGLNEKNEGYDFGDCIRTRPIK